MNESVLERTVIFCAILTIGILLAATVLKINSYTNQQITGNSVATAVILPMRATNCNFTLHEGKNAVSFFCITLEEDRDTVIGNLTHLTSVFSYNEGHSDPWKSFNPHLPPFVIQDLDKISRLDGYWMVMSEPEAFVLEGGLRVPNNIQLYQGWNFPGNPTNQTEDANESFASLENMSQARRFDNVNKVYQIYLPGFVSGFSQTAPYEAYWMNMSSNGVWIVD